RDHTRYRAAQPPGAAARSVGTFHRRDARCRHRLRPTAGAPLRAVGAQRQPEREDGSLAELALDRQVAAEEPCDAAADREAEAHALHAAGARAGALELLEEPL